MSYVIAVIGAGGKSFYIDKHADIYASRGQRVCITTTTHIYNMPDRENVVHIGKSEGFKLSYPGDDEYNNICKNFDIVFVEADGSHHRPVKIPAKYEPVIPENVNEIIVAMGHHACGRPIGEVCHRFDPERLMINENELLNSKTIDTIAYEYYVNPLQKKAKVKYFRNNLTSSLKDYAEMNIAFILMCSGKSKRFGSNKLMYNFNGKELFRHGLDALISAKNLLALDGINSKIFVTGGNEALEHCIKNLYSDVNIIANHSNSEGISSSIRCGVDIAIKHGFDALLFLAADMPLFPAQDIKRLTEEFLCSGKLYGCAYSSYPSNPALFRPECYLSLQKLTGDRGAMKIIHEHPEKAYYYVVNKNKLIDIDTHEDIISL